jgi:outer membrane protein assembly factor BamB
MSVALPMFQQTAPPPVPPSPPAQGTTPSPPAAAPATPAPPPDPYEAIWSVAVDVDRPALVTSTAGTVAVAGGTKVIGITLADGTERWHASTVAAITALGAAGASVLVGSEHTLQALDPISGDVRWRTTVAGTPDHLVSRGGWIVASAGASLGAFRAKDGSAVWQATLGPAILGEPAVDGDGVFVALADGRLMRLALATGDTQWTIWLDGAAGSPLAASDRVYVSVGSGGFLAFAQATGQFVWRYPFRASTIGAAVSDTTHVYVAVLDNTVQALDRHVGNQRWQTQLGARPADGPIVAGDQILIPSSTGEIGVSRSRDGKMLGHIPAPAATDGLPGTTPHLVAATITTSATGATGATGATDVTSGEVIRLMANRDTTLTLAAFRRTKPKPKGKTS